MLGNIIFGVLILVELGLLVFSFREKSNLKRERSIAKIVLFLAFLLLAVTPIIDWGFQWTMLAVVLGIQALTGVLALVRKKKNSSLRKAKVIFAFLGQVLLVGMAILPALVFPQYAAIEPTGEYSIGTVSYTLTDESREEYFTEEKDNRKVTVQFWYPTEQGGQEETIAKGKFPLVIFSHGAFGYRMSNYSTYQELASHGYIVGSIDHTYHAFMTKQEDGKTIITDMEFMNNAMRAQNNDTTPKETYELQQEWMKLRTGDMSFVLDYIRKAAASANASALYQSMDLEHIGVFGHSMGGATSAKLGRVDQTVDAVVVVDGTMFGEITGFENGKDIITDVPYPKPLMNIYGESHYAEALAQQDEYMNIKAYKHGIDTYQVVVKGAGHMNFTDLAIISPALSKMLGSGTIDSRYCIEATNKVILEFFDRYLKLNNIEIPKERTL